MCTYTSFINEIMGFNIEKYSHNVIFYDPYFYLFIYTVRG